MRRAAGSWLLSIGALVLAGCSYQCHTYDYVAATVADGGWKVTGELTRQKPVADLDQPGSFPHWPPDPDDRYTLVLVPVSADSRYWLQGTVDIENVRVLAGGLSSRVEWEGSGKRRFVSAPFHIREAPDVLPIEFDLVLLDAESGNMSRVIHVVTHAVADRHRRWYIRDMAES